MHSNIIIFLVDDMGTGDTSAYQDWTGNQDDEQQNLIESNDHKQFVESMSAKLLDIYHERV